VMRNKKPPPKNFVERGFRLAEIYACASVSS